MGEKKVDEPLLVHLALDGDHSVPLQSLRSEHYY